MLLQLLPDANDQVFRRAHFALHEIHIQVEVLVIHLFDDIFTDDLAQFLYIEHETGVGIGLAPDGHIQLIIMSMPVLIGAFAKDFLILLTAPAWVIELMCRIEMLQARQIDHG